MVPMHENARTMMTVIRGKIRAYRVSENKGKIAWAKTTKKMDKVQLYFNN